MILSGSRGVECLVKQPSMIAPAGCHWSVFCSEKDYLLPMVTFKDSDERVRSFSIVHSYHIS